MTSDVAVLAAQGETAISASKGVFGDPATQHFSRLHVVYLLDGGPIEKPTSENETTQLVQADPPSHLPAFDHLGWAADPIGAGTYRWITAAGTAQRRLLKHAAEGLTLSGPSALYGCCCNGGG